MAPLDTATLINAVVAALALGLRGNMLKPEARGWASSRAASLIIMGLSVTMAGVAIDIHGRGGVTAREAAVITAVALSSVAMLIHLWRQRRAPSSEAQS